MDEIRLELTCDATRHGILLQLEELIRLRGGRPDMSLVRSIPDGHCRNLSQIVDIIDGVHGASDRVKGDMRSIYGILAKAEASVHGCPVEETHFHEVGNAEAIRTVLRMCRAAEMLAPQRITATPVQVGSGTITCSHGVLDVPAPATAAILAQGIPICETRLDGELCTPTSAAFILHYVDGFEGASHLPIR
jgi:uncharacterized protein (DUF111 family)